MTEPVWRWSHPTRCGPLFGGCGGTCLIQIAKHEWLCANYGARVLAVRYLRDPNNVYREDEG